MSVLTAPSYDCHISRAIGVVNVICSILPCLLRKLLPNSVLRSPSVRGATGIIKACSATTVVVRILEEETLRLVRDLRSVDINIESWASLCRHSRSPR